MKISKCVPQFYQNYFLIDFQLCDFGIIRIATSTTTCTNQILGTSAYMPPEAHRFVLSKYRI